MGVEVCAVTDNGAGEVGIDHYFVRLMGNQKQRGEEDMVEVSL